MTNISSLRVGSLRDLFKQKGINAYIVPSTDPHLSEYVADHWKSREWISGFTGSAGTVVITSDKAGLWTDSRYFLQAADQLQDSCITLYKDMLPETPSITEFLSNELSDGSVVGIDGKMFSDSQVTAYKSELSTHGISILDTGDLITEIWNNRPALPQGQALLFADRYAGRKTSDKIQDIRTTLKAAYCDCILVSALDEIAWTLNLRGNDIHCNPVIVSYLLITPDSVHYFVQPQKISAKVVRYLQYNGVTLHDYEEIEAYLKQLELCSIMLDRTRTNYTLCQAVRHLQVIHTSSPINAMKGIRNQTEIRNIRKTMIYDGVALVRFQIWLEQAIKNEERVTEMTIGAMLKQFRQEQPGWLDESFDTIAGYGPHGAIVHYEATPETDTELQPHGFVLIDSGAQYLTGTTDITRTIALGPLTHEEKNDYTLVLKGHIDLAMAVFPEGTRGTQLDILARLPLLKQRKNYLHGTGHGVGHCLNVHEGPQSIRMNENPVTLKVGMVTSNEPGIYIAGKHGVRTENLVLTRPAGSGLYGNYLRFETLTLCPICTKGIIRSLLTDEEVKWLNNYHKTVYNKLAPHLSKKEQTWLRKATQSIN